MKKLIAAKTNKKASLSIGFPRRYQALTEANRKKPVTSQPVFPRSSIKLNLTSWKRVDCIRRFLRRRPNGGHLVPPTAPLLSSRGYLLAEGPCVS